MREKLQKRFPDGDLEPIITRLKELNYLNDDEFADRFIAYRHMTSPRGKYALSRELVHKGISKSVVDRHLEHHDESEDLGTLAHQKWQKIRENDLMRKKAKLIRFLTARGFSFSDVLDTVKKL